MTDREIMCRAKMYIDKMANGINPLTNEPIKEDDFVNNVRISRCLFYVSDVLHDVLEGKLTSRTKSRSKKPFTVTPELLEQFNYSDTPLTVSEIIRRLNSLVDLNEYKKLRFKQVSGWLESVEIIKITDENGYKHRLPTQDGFKLGLYTEKRSRYGNNYTVVLFNRELQQFIIDNLQAILDFVPNNNQDAPDEESEEN